MMHSQMHQFNIVKHEEGEYVERTARSFDEELPDVILPGLTHHMSHNNNTAVDASFSSIDQAKQVIRKEIHDVIRKQLEKFSLLPKQVVLVLNQPKKGEMTSVGNVIFLNVVVELRDLYKRSCRPLQTVLADMIVGELGCQVSPIVFADECDTTGSIQIVPWQTAVERTARFLRLANHKLKDARAACAITATAAAAAPVDPVIPSAKKPRQLLQPRDCDVSLGRGSKLLHHTGNVRFREVVRKYQNVYAQATTYEKREVAGKVMEKFKSMNPKVRFFFSKRHVLDPKTEWKVLDRDSVIKRFMYSLDRAACSKKLIDSSSMAKKIRWLKEKQTADATGPTNVSRTDQLLAGNQGPQVDDVAASQFGLKSIHLQQVEHIRSVETKVCCYLLPLQPLQPPVVTYAAAAGAGQFDDAVDDPTCIPMLTPAAQKEKKKVHFQF